MVIANVSLAMLEKACAATEHVILENVKPLNKAKTRWQVKLSPDTSIPWKERKWRKRNGNTGHKVNAVNWYGFEAFFAHIYSQAYYARITSMLGTYKDRMNFEENHKTTLYKPLGSVWGCEWNSQDEFIPNDCED